MKYSAIPILIVLLTGCGKEVTVNEDKSHAEISAGASLRQMILTTPVDKAGFSPDAEFPEVYGVLTDWNIGQATATIMSMRDGTASLYTTASFGIIGGQGHETVRQAAVRYVKAAQSYADSAKPVTEFPYPESGKVYFYLLTYNGVLLCVGDENGIKRNSDPTRPLFSAAQDVLTQLRLITEDQDAQ